MFCLVWQLFFLNRDPRARLNDIDKKKFLAPADISVAKFIQEIRKHIKLGRQESLFVFVADNVMPQPNSTMSQVYAQHKDDDGFLYVVYSAENSFGAVWCVFFVVFGKIEWREKYICDTVLAGTLTK